MDMIFVTWNVEGLRRDGSLKSVETE